MAYGGSERTTNLNPSETHEEHVMTDQNGYNYGSDDKLHHLIISIKEADIANWTGFKDWFDSSLNPFVKVIFNDGKQNINELIQTRKIYRSNGNPNWNFVKRFSFKNKLDLPQNITFQVFDYNDSDDGKEDEIIGTFKYDIEQQSLTSKEQNMWKTLCKLTKDDKDTNCTITIGLYYKYCSLHSLKDNMRESKKQCTMTRIKKCASNWIDSNKKLISLLKYNEKYNIQITSEDFSDMRFPPYQLIKNDYKEFLKTYSKIQRIYGFTKSESFNNNNDDEEKQMNNKQANYQIYYDTDCDILYYANSESFYFGGENITAQVQIMFRYVFLKDILLKNQDSEFNIYRSYYFEPRHDKMAMALLALILQITLTVAITINIINDWDILLNQNNYFIVFCSVLVFCFISYSTNGTAKLFSQFYKDIGLAYDLPYFLVFCDFISNIVIALYVCFISLFFLIQSPNYGELVLNSFALTFLIEIDDIINIFDSDEEVIIIADLREFVKSNCESPRAIHYQITDFFEVLLSPFKIFLTLMIFFQQFYKLFIKRQHTMDHWKKKK